MSRRRLRKAGSRLPALAASFVPALAASHELNGPQGSVEIEWSAPNISRVMSSGYGDSLGMEADVLLGMPEIVIVGERRCIEGSYILFDVEDDFAFDIDEAVTVDLLLAENGASKVSFAYDKNGDAETLQVVDLDPASDGMIRQSITLPRARFADRGEAGSDLMVGGGSVYYPGQPDADHRIIVCDIAIERGEGYLVPVNGVLELRVVDESGAAIPARVGLYDAIGRSPLPSSDALEIPFYDDRKRQIFLRDSHGKVTPWPHENRHIFYVDGSYRAEIPAHEYQLVVSRGPEFRMTMQSFRIDPGKQTSVTAVLDRFIDMPSRGWYSGDDHIHIARGKDDNRHIATLMRAEDIHVSNLLQMGNPESRHFRQYAFGADGRYFLPVPALRHYGLVPGVEDPRTALRGHTISLNIEEVVRPVDAYLHYDQTFLEYKRQGGMSGYAHVAGQWFNVARGLALDVPLGVVDFLEVLQDGTLGTDLWYDFLNLGFNLVPTAGSDFPYLNQPGAERNYVFTGRNFSADAWFANLAAGRTFVTNGPLLTLDVNGEGMGSTINSRPGDTLQVGASVRLNPDLEALDRLELVVNGDVVERVDANRGDLALTLNRAIDVDRGFWLAVRAYGASEMVAHSAPVFVVTDQRGFRADEKVPAIVERMKTRLAEFKSLEVDEGQELETWEVGPALRSMLKQQHRAILVSAETALGVYDAILQDVQSWH